MSDFTTKKCDGCGRLKQEANHWFVAVLGGPTFAVYPYSDGVRIRQRSGEVKDVCGEDCAHKLLSIWFQKQGASAGKEVTTDLNDNHVESQG